MTLGEDVILRVFVKNIHSIMIYSSQTRSIIVISQLILYTTQFQVNSVIFYYFYIITLFLCKILIGLNFNFFSISIFVLSHFLVVEL